MTWYNKYRPQNFSEVIGQNLIKSVLVNALKKGRIKNAYLLSGPKGVGKTTLARIFANELNEITENPEAKIDIIELDAASNTGIDNIRQLIESAQTPPISGKYKIYIIDEVHMLSKSAMNALLKIIEEPPEYLVFLLATTNPEKLLPTVLSRLTKLNLASHSTADIIQKLSTIAESEQIKIDPQSLEIIATRAGGSQRDAINLLETVASYDLERISLKETREILGLVENELLEEVADSLLNSTLSKERLNQLEKLGLDGDSFLGQFLDYLLDKSLSGEKNLDLLITPIAEVISLKLQLASPVSALAVVHARLTPPTIFIPGKATPRAPNPKPSTDEKNKKKKPKTEIEEKKIIEKSTDKSENSQLHKRNQIEDDQGYRTQILTQNKPQNALKPDEIKNFLDTIAKDKNSPPILKMLIQDLHVQKVENNILTIWTSSGIFLNQLKSSKIQAFVKDKLKQKFSIIFDLKIEQNNPKSSRLISKNSEVNKNKALDLDTRGGEFFYKVYKKLPKNVDPLKIVVYPNPVPDPIKSEVDQWDSHAEEMFDLE